jgi:hypothetical protein
MLKKKEMPLWAKTGHRKPVTRREFLSHGLIPFAASAMVPGALGLLTTSVPSAMAQALSCPGDSSVMASFITLNLAGGAALSSNFLPRDAGGQLLPSYGKMGGGTAANLTTVNEFGVNAFVSTSPLLTGLKSVATAATLANTAFVGVCAQSQDDSAGNKLDASGMAYKAGALGSMLPNLGSQSSATGIRQMASTVQPPPPLVVKSFNDLANSIGYTAALKNSLSATQRSSLTKLVQNLSTSQSRKLAQIQTAAQVQTLVECAGIKNTSLISQGSGAVDPLTNNPNVATVWQINANTAANAQGRVFGSMVYNSLAGKAGTVNLELGGYDYHDNSRNTGDTRDRAAGVVIGQILESARLMNKATFIYVISDGSVVSADSANPGAPWTSDRGSAGSALIFMYSPAGRPATSGQQIGQYTTGQVADGSAPTGANPEVAAQAVFANYLAFNKRTDLFASIVPGSVLNGSVLQGVLKVG